MYRVPSWEVVRLINLITTSCSIYGLSHCLTFSQRRSFTGNLWIGYIFELELNWVFKAAPNLYLLWRSKSKLVALIFCCQWHFSIICEFIYFLTSDITYTSAMQIWSWALFAAAILQRLWFLSYIYCYFASMVILNHFAQFWDIKMLTVYCLLFRPVDTHIHTQRLSLGLEEGGKPFSSLNDYVGGMNTRWFTLLYFDIGGTYCYTWCSYYININSLLHCNRNTTWGLLEYVKYVTDRV